MHNVPRSNTSDSSKWIDSHKNFLSNPPKNQVLLHDLLSSSHNVPLHQGRQSIPKSEGDGLQIRKVRRYATRNFLNFGTLKRHFQRFEGTYKVIVQCA